MISFSFFNVMGILYHTSITLNLFVFPMKQFGSKTLNKVFKGLYAVSIFFVKYVSRNYFSYWVPHTYMYLLEEKV